MNAPRIDNQREAIDGRWASAPLLSRPARTGSNRRRTGQLAQQGSGLLGSRVRHSGFLTGVSLAGVLQMLHIERKSMVIEVNGGADYGTLTVVNGELVDAEVGDEIGEAAVYELLSWPSPRVTLLAAVPLFRHSIREKLTQLLLEAARREDESFHANGSSVVGRETPDPVAADHDWQWLVETLIVGGASSAVVLAPESGHVLAEAAEPGARCEDPTCTAMSLALAKATQLLPGAITDAVYRFGAETALVSPLDDPAATWVVAQCSGDDVVEMLRSVVRTLVKTRD